MEVVAQQTIQRHGRRPAPARQAQATSRKTPGEYKLTLEAVPQPGELVTTNNQLSTFVNVLKGGLNVLYIEGALRVEQKFIRRALDSSPDIKVDYVRLDPRDPKTRPRRFRRTLQAGQVRRLYPGRRRFDGLPRRRACASWPTCVSRGAGLMMLGGFQSFGPGGYGETPLANVLPVGMDRLERQQPDEPLRTDLHWPGPLAMRPTPLGLMHFALMLAGNRQENAALWAKLPPLEGANKFHDLAPGAVVLADAGSDKPLLVAHNFGDGRVMAFAGDSTWRWWMHGYESAFKRFWRQIVLWLARKDQAQEGNVWVRLAAAPLCALAAGGVHGGGQLAHRRADRRRRVQGRNRFARRRPAAAGPGPPGRPDGRLVPRHADAGDYAIEVHGHAERTSRWARPGRGSSSSSKTWNWTTPRPTPPRWKVWRP